MSRKIKRYYVCLHTAGPIGQLGNPRQYSKSYCKWPDRTEKFQTKF